MSDALALLGDWNATPADRGRYTPHWIATTAGLEITSAGPGRHGDIDYLLADCPVENPKRFPPPGGMHRSDHDAITYWLHHPHDRDRSLKVATWNLLYGRPEWAATRDVRWLLRERRPDVVAFQEAGDYHRVIRHEASQLGYRTLAYKGPGRRNQVLTVRGSLSTVRPRLVQLSPFGWPLAEGNGTHAPLYMTAWLVDDWLRVGCVHMPPNVNWRRRRPRVAYGPPRKLAAYVAGAAKLARWASNRREARS